VGHQEQLAYANMEELFAQMAKRSVSTQFIHKQKLVMVLTTIAMEQLTKV
jgi:hypothetical protein